MRWSHLPGPLIYDWSRRETPTGLPWPTYRGVQQRSGPEWPRHSWGGRHVHVRGTRPDVSRNNFSFLFFSFSFPVVPKLTWNKNNFRVTTRRQPVSAGAFTWSDAIHTSRFLIASFLFLSDSAHLIDVVLRWKKKRWKTVPFPRQLSPRERNPIIKNETNHLVGAFSLTR